MTASTVSGRSIGGVTYVETDKDYFAKRQLKRTAGAFGLWAIGISAVISGDFSGWNGGIAQAGWGGMLVAAIVVYLMYVLMLNSISEMASGHAAHGWRVFLRACRHGSVGRLLHRPCGNHRVCDDRSHHRLLLVGIR